jgi:hypothetical protein
MLRAHPGARHAARAEARIVAAACHRAADEWVRRAEGEERDGSRPDRLPRWRTAPRDADQLRGMREALEALRVHIAYELERREAAETLKDELVLVDEKLAAVDLLWIERPPAEIRGGIGDALMTGLDRAYALGRRLAETGPEGL